MKINIFLTIISLLLASLLGYLAFNMAENDENAILGGLVSGLCFVSTLIPIIGLQYDTTRLGVNIRIMSGLFVIAFLISHYSYAGWGINMPYYLIVNGVFFLIYLVIFYKMGNINKV